MCQLKNFLSDSPIFLKLLPSNRCLATNLACMHQLKAQYSALNGCMLFTMPRYSTRTRRFSRKPKRTYRRKSYKRGSTIKRRVNDYYGQRIYKYCKAMTFASQTSNSDGTSYKALSYGFAVSSLAEWTSFKNLYDTYRIDKVSITFRATQNVAALGAVGNIDVLRSVVDYDGLVIATPAGFDEYQNCKKTRWQTEHTRTIYPKVQRVLDSAQPGETAVFSHETCRAPWIDTAYEDCLHRGVSFLIPPSPNADTVINYQVNVRMWLSFKNQR